MDVLIQLHGQMTAVWRKRDDTVIAQVTYTYDSLGNRIGMDENGTQTWTLYDGSDPVMDFNSSGSLEMRYLNGPTASLSIASCQGKLRRHGGLVLA